VVKQQRKNWHIPRIDARERLLEQKREEEQIRALCEGTTPQGREILRKIIFRVERMLEDGTPALEIVSSVEGELKRFEILRPEFLLLIHRLWGLSLENLCKAPAKVLAITILLKLKIARALRIAMESKRQAHDERPPACPQKSPSGLASQTVK
jgi:hypothetical protein